MATGKGFGLSGVTDAVATDLLQYRILQGALFGASVFKTAVAADATVDMLLRVAANSSAHIRWQAAGSADLFGQLFEDPTTSADGSAVTAFNYNRFLGSRMPSTLVFDGPTVTAEGTEIESVFLPGGAGFISPGGSSASQVPFILDPGDYLVRVTNQGSVAASVHVSQNWHEPTEADLGAFPYV